MKVFQLANRLTQMRLKTLSGFYHFLVVEMHIGQMGECMKMLVQPHQCSFSHIPLKQNHYMSLIDLNIYHLVSHPYIPHCHVSPLLASLLGGENNKLYYMNLLKHC